MKYGFIGLGNLGRNLATSLVRAGFDVTVHDRDAMPLQGAVWADTPLAVAQACEAVFTCLPSPVASEAVLRSMLPAAFSGHRSKAIRVESSTWRATRCLPFSRQRLAR